MIYYTIFCNTVISQKVRSTRYRFFFFLERTKTEWKVYFVYLDTNKTFADHYVESENRRINLKKLVKHFDFTHQKIVCFVI